MSTNTDSMARPKRLYRVESYYRSSIKPDVYYVVASGSTAAENAVLAHEKYVASGYFRTEQVAEQRSDDFLPVPHALLFELAGHPTPQALAAALTTTLDEESRRVRTEKGDAAKPVPTFPREADEILEHIKWGTQKPTP